MELAMRGLPCVRLRLPPLDTHAYKTSRSFQTGARSAIFLSKSKPKMSIDISKSSTDDLVKILQEKEVAQEAVSAVIDAGLDGKMMLGFERDDIQDLLPGSSMFLVRKSLWKFISELKVNKSQENKPEVYRPMENGKKRQIENTLSPPSSTKALKTGSSVFNSKIATTSSPAASKDSFEQICGSPVLSMETISFPIYSDPALVTALNDGNRVSTEDRNRVVRNQLTMMRAECANLNNPREPDTAELKQVAEALILKYPALSDDKDLNPLRPWDGLFKQLKRRLANVKPTKKPQGKTPKRSKVQRLLLSENSDEMNQNDVDNINTQSVSSEESNETVDLGLLGVLEYEVDSDDKGNNMNDKGNEDQMTRHYAKLQEQFKLQNPKNAVLQQLLKLELPGRRLFIETLKGDVVQKASKFLEAYPCFKSVDECIREIQRLVAPGDAGYIDDVIQNMDAMWDKLIYFGLFKQVIKSPHSFDIEAKAVLVLENIEKMLPAKKKTKKVEIFTKVDNDQDIDKLVKRSKHPQLLLVEDSLLVAVGGHMLSPLRRGEWSKGVMALLGTYYCLNLCYPAGVETAFLFLQTEVLKDNIHGKDKTEGYKDALSAFKEFSKTD